MAGGGDQQVRRQRDQGDTSDSSDEDSDVSTLFRWTHFGEGKILLKKYF